MDQRDTRLIPGTKREGRAKERAAGGRERDRETGTERQIATGWKRERETGARESETGGSEASGLTRTELC